MLEEEAGLEVGADVQQLAVAGVADGHRHVAAVRRVGHQVGQRLVVHQVVHAHAVGKFREVEHGLAVGAQRRAGQPEESRHAAVHRRGELAQLLAVPGELVEVAVAEQVRARHLRQRGAERRARAGAHRVADQVLAEVDGAVAGEVDVGERAVGELDARQLLAFRADADHGEAVAVEGPQRAVRREAQAAHQVRRALRPENALFLQVAVVLEDAPVAGVVVVGAVEQRGAGEDVAPGEGLHGGHVGHVLVLRKVKAAILAAAAGVATGRGQGWPVRGRPAMRVFRQLPRPPGGQSGGAGGKMQVVSA